jgi:hypothetical protein
MKAMQSTSHSFPRLMRLLVNPGMMCPVHVTMVGKVGSANCVVATEVFALPVGVRMVVCGAAQLRSRSRAESMK